MSTNPTVSLISIWSLLFVAPIFAKPDLPTEKVEQLEISTWNP